jgi:hypothetical protein
VSVFLPGVGAALVLIECRAAITVPSGLDDQPKGLKIGYVPIVTRQAKKEEP